MDSTLGSEPMGGQNTPDENIPEIIKQLRSTFGELSQFMEPHAYHVGLNKTLNELCEQFIVESLGSKIMAKAQAALSPRRCYDILLGLLMPALDKEGDKDDIISLLEVVDLEYLFASAISGYYFAQLQQYVQLQLMERNTGINDAPYSSGRGYGGNAGTFAIGNSSTSSFNPASRSEGSRYGQQEYLPPSGGAVPPQSHTPSPYSQSITGGSAGNSGTGDDSDARYGRPPHNPPSQKLGNSEASNRKPAPSNIIAESRTNNTTNINHTGNTNSNNSQLQESSPSSSAQTHNFSSSVPGRVSPAIPGAPVIRHQVHHLIRPGSVPQRGPGSAPSANSGGTTTPMQPPNPLPMASTAVSGSRGGQDHSSAPSHNSMPVPLNHPTHNYSGVPQPIGKEGSPVSEGPRGGIKQQSPSPAGPNSNSSHNTATTHLPPPPQAQATPPKPPATPFQPIHHHLHAAPMRPPAAVGPEKIQHHIYHVHHHHDVLAVPPPNSASAPGQAPRGLPVHFHNVLRSSPAVAGGVKAKGPAFNIIPFHAHHISLQRPPSQPQPTSDLGRVGNSPAPVDFQGGVSLAQFVEKNPNLNQSTQPTEAAHTVHVEAPHHHTAVQPNSRGGFGRGRGGPPQPLNPSSPTSDGSMMGGRGDLAESANEDFAKKTGKGGRGGGEYLNINNNSNLPRYDNDDGDGVERGLGAGRKRGGRGGFSRGSRLRGGGNFEESRPCRFHTQGQCRFGENCRNLHVDNPNGGMT